MHPGALNSERVRAGRVRRRRSLGGAPLACSAQDQLRAPLSGSGSSFSGAAEQPARPGESRIKTSLPDPKQTPKWPSNSIFVSLSAQLK